MARINPYSAFIWHNACTRIQKTEDMKENIQYVVEQLKSIVGTSDKPEECGGELPVKLIALPEAFCTAWPDVYDDMDPMKVYNEVYATTIPGPETDMLGEAAKATGAYIMACMQARDPELMEERVFNISFIINPEGKVICKRHKSSIFFRERVTCPSDIWDRYIEKYGDDSKALMDAIYPVAKTEIGNLATTICGEADKPEVFRALAMNGAEVIYRAAWVRGFYDQFELQDRAHAYFNNCYLICPNCPVTYAPGGTRPLSGGDQTGHIIDYRGNVIAKTQYTAWPEVMAYATIDVEQLRYHRFHSLWQNTLAHLRMEEYILPYQYALDMGGLYPKNLAMDEPPMTQRPHDDVIRYCINRAVELGIWTPPDGWEPFKIPQEILDKIAKAKARPQPVPKSKK